MQIRKKKGNANDVICKILGAYSGWIFGGLLMMLFFCLLTQNTEVRENELDAVASSLRIHHGHMAKRVESIVKPGSDLTCLQAKQNVIDKTWPDPNEGRIWARETITFPHFRISLHAQEYDSVRWRIMDEGKYYEDEVHARFVQILQNQPSSYILDVGANIGYYTLLSASLGHKVIAFEPNPANIMRLCDSLRLNDFNLGDPEINIFQNAVSNVHGEEMMLHSPKNPGQAFLKPIEDRNEETNDHKAKTTVIMLDKLAQEQGWLDNPNFQIKLLKIDVEGKEPQVVIGAPELLKSGKVENILTEGRRFGRTNIQDSFVVLFDAGYTIKEPKITIEGATPKQKSKFVCDWYLKKLGPNSMAVQDMWWVRA